MLDKPLVSIVMPMHNSETTLEDTIETLLDQSEDNFELICVDDESTDASREVVSEIAQHDGRVQLVSLRKSNAGHARNVGIEVATGKYLLFLDSDDLFDRDMLRRLSSIMQGSQADIAVCEADSFRASEKSRNELISFHGRYSEGVYDQEELGRDLFEDFGRAAWNKMFDHDFVVRNGLSFQEQPAVNDAKFTICALASAKKIALVPESFVLYRVGSGTSIQDKVSDFPLAHISAAESIAGYVTNRCELGSPAIQSLMNVLFSLSITSVERSVVSEGDFYSVYNRLQDDMADWHIDDVPTNYFSNNTSRFNYLIFSKCGPALTYWVYRARKNSRRQSLFSRAHFLVRGGVAILLSLVASKDQGKNESLNRGC